MVFRLIFFTMLLLTIVCSKTFSQNETNIWLFGGNSSNIELQGYQFGNTIMDFSDIEPSIYYDSLVTMDFAGTNSSICDSQGNLLLYTNGMQVFGEDHKAIENGDTIAHSDIWELWSLKDFFENGDDWIVGLPIIQNCVILPLDSEEERYLVMYQVFSRMGEVTHVKSLNYSLIQIDQNSDFKITKKDELIFEDELTWGQVHPCRHANGRDWWMIQQSTWGDTISVFMISDDEINLHNQTYRERRNVALTTNQVAYNSTGEIYAIANGQYLNEVGGERGTVLNVFSFDRCDGTLSELGTDITDNTGVISFSSNGRFLYTSSHDEIYQYDMYESDWQASRETIAVYDGFTYQYNEFSSEFKTRFGSMALGPDGRIYSVPSGSNRFLNVIEYPDEKGESAEVRQHKIMMPTENHTSTPNLPNYRLGPIEGSICDSLGLESVIKAQFRFEEDSTNYLNIRFTDISYNDIDSWYWEFGDGEIYDGKKPYYHEYSEAGAYNACLTVRRGIKEDKFCKTLYLGVTSNENIRLTANQVKVYPNPISDIINIELVDYVPIDAQIIIYNSLGEVVSKQKMKSHLNQVDFRDQYQGAYHLTIVSSKGLLYSDTVLKF